MRLVTDIADLVLGRTCVACGEFGPPMCDPCLDRARRSGFRRLGSDLVIAAGTRYQGVGRTVVLAHKRQLTRGLAPALGCLMADAVGRIQPTPVPLVLVPIPSHRQAARERGQDTVRAIARAAVIALRSRGRPAELQPLLIRADARASLAGATRAERRIRVAGAFAARARTNDPVIVVDDVVTSGATMRSAIEVLRTADCLVIGGVAVAG
jgi:predicted amidophosphoribosyltransferase